MANIVPAILGETFAEIKEKLEKIQGLSDWVQIDIADGVFAEPITWSRPLDLWEPTDLPKIELHLMVQNPHPYLRDWLPASIDRVVLHVESEGNINEYLERVKGHGLQVGLALKLETPIEVADPYIKNIDVVQLMSISTIGAYGQPFDEKVLDKIKRLRAKYSGVTISIDGGITLETGKKAIEAGANQLVVGSGIFKSDNVSKTLSDFNSI
jgi:ribulose-phosphate 3-epimerase